MFYTFLLLRMSNPRTPGCDSEENEFAKQGGITNGAAWLVLFPFKFSSFFISLFFLLTQSKKIASGTPWAVGCRTSTISPPTTSRSPSSSAATSTHPRRGGRDQNVEALENIFLNSLEGEWKDNKASLMEFMWAAHRGIKGMVNNHIVDTIELL